jgi:hypothetical protein
MFLPHCVTLRILRYDISGICRTYYRPPVKLILVATSISNYKLQPFRNCIEHVVSKSLDSYQTGKGLKSNLQWRRGMAVNCIQHFNKSSESTIINNSVQPVFFFFISLSTYTDLQIPSLSLCLCISKIIHRQKYLVSYLLQIQFPPAHRTSNQLGP